ncbi:hypothetical protein LTR97_012603 [Elasticomyces elasticus]|uniref:Uncharacterized protein n=1 Tax=Elasticomyces elasticus TaxID=574655 RepID=A0AAN7VVH2_9PEZI|nr:hypothetical protein LTR97_012603 [Elasticomyces elasticus]
MTLEGKQTCSQVVSTTVIDRQELQTVLLNPALDIDLKIGLNLSNSAPSPEPATSPRRSRAGQNNTLARRLKIQLALIYMQPDPQFILRSIKEIKAFVTLNANVHQRDFTMCREDYIHRGVAFTKITRAGHGSGQNNIFLVFK